MSPLFKSLSFLTIQSVSADHPGTVCEGVIGWDIAAVDSQTERARTDTEIGGGICQVDPSLWGIRLVTGDTMMTRACFINISAA
jgi:hypothetical protein